MSVKDPILGQGFRLAALLFLLPLALFTVWILVLTGSHRLDVPLFAIAPAVLGAALLFALFAKRFNELMNACLSFCSRARLLKGMELQARLIELQQVVEAPQKDVGTLIRHFGIWGDVRYWWTTDDIFALSPVPIPCDPPEGLPSTQWVSAVRLVRGYVDFDRGMAKLVVAPAIERHINTVSEFHDSGTARKNERSRG